MNNLFGDASGTQLNRIFNSDRSCKRCGVQYTEKTNIGRWRCMAFHPLSRFTTPHDTQYPCCDRAIGSDGCVPADHTDVVLFDVAPKLLSRQDMATLGLEKFHCARSWLPDGNTGGYVVHRVDRSAYEESIDPGRVNTSDHLQDRMCSPLNRSTNIV